MPEAPAAPTTRNFNDNVIVEWNAPEENGEALLGYYVYLRQSNGVYTMEPIHCNGSSPDIILAKSCTIPLNTLTQSPFTLQFGPQLGEYVNVKVIAYNEYGNSNPSPIGGLARIQIVPDPPASFGYDLFQTIDTEIGLQWTDGDTIGGTPILEYIVYWDQGAANGVFVLLRGEITL